MRIGYIIKMKRGLLILIFVIILTTLVTASNYAIIFKEDYTIADEPQVAEQIETGEGISGKKYYLTEEIPQEIQAIDYSTWTPISRSDTQFPYGVFYYDEEETSYRGTYAMIFEGEEGLEISKYYFTVNEEYDFQELFGLEQNLQIVDSELVSENEETINILVLEDSTTLRKVGGNQFSEVGAGSILELERTSGNIISATINVGENDGIFLVQSQKYEFPTGSVVEMDGNILTNFELPEDAAGVKHYLKSGSTWAEEPILISGADEITEQNGVLSVIGENVEITDTNGDILNVNGNVLYASHDDFFMGGDTEVTMQYGEDTLKVSSISEEGVWMTGDCRRAFDVATNTIDRCGNKLTAVSKGEGQFFVEVEEDEGNYIAYGLTDETGQVSWDTETNTATISGTVQEQNCNLIVDYQNGKPSIPVGEAYGSACQESFSSYGDYLVENEEDEETGEMLTEVSKLERTVPIANNNDQSQAIAQAGGEGKPVLEEGLNVLDYKCRQVRASDVDETSTGSLGKVLLGASDLQQVGLKCTAEVAYVQNGEILLEQKYSEEELTPGLVGIGFDYNKYKDLSLEEAREEFFNKEFPEQFSENVNGLMGDTILQSQVNSVLTGTRSLNEISSSQREGVRQMVYSTCVDEIEGVIYWRCAGIDRESIFETDDQRLALESSRRHGATALNFGN